MSTIKTATIERHCTNHTAINILRDRGVISDLEAEAMHARARRQDDKAYARIYHTSAANLYESVLAEAGAPDLVIEAARAATTEPVR